MKNLSTRNALAELEIPLPNLSAQQRMSAILDHADAVLARRRKSLALLDDLGQSIFLDLFGEPLRWVGGDDVEPLGSLIRLKSGHFLPASAMAGGDIPVFGGNGVNGWHDTALLAESTICIGRVGAYCGCVHVTEGPAWITDNAMYVAESDDRLERQYLSAALHLLKLNRFASQSGQPLISGSRIGGVPVRLPSKAVQVEFGSRMTALAKMTREAQRGLLLGQGLADALRARFFVGATS